MRRVLRMAALVTGLAAPLAAGPGSQAAAWELPVCADPDSAPYSTEDRRGFDNRIAEAIAAELGADIRFVWMQDHRLRTQLRHLQAGECDAVMGVIEGQRGTLNSLAYYRTGFVFVTDSERGPKIGSLDDPRLDGLRIGLMGGARKPTPPSIALTRRGHLAGLRNFGVDGQSGGGAPAMIEALKRGDLDLAILWGPAAADAIRGADDLSVTPVSPEIDIPFLPMVASFTVGVRPHDEALRDAIDRALSAIWGDVQTTLADAGIPTLPLPAPIQHGASQ